MGRPKLTCTCAHVGQCPINDAVDPLHATYPDGTKVNRPLTDAEQAQARIRVNGQVLRQPQLGELVGTEPNGDMRGVAMAIDPERAIAYARTMADSKRKCRGLNRVWRLFHRVPEADTRLTAEQYDAWVAAGGEPSEG